MAQRVLNDTGLVYPTRGKWDGEPLSGAIVFSCVDSMDVRKRILDEMLHGTFIETRMGVKHGQVYTIDASIEDERTMWLDNWLPDSEMTEEVSACGTSLTIGATAQLLSSIASWQCIHVMNGQQVKQTITACVDPFTLM